MGKASGNVVNQYEGLGLSAPLVKANTQAWINIEEIKQISIISDVISNLLYFLTRTIRLAISINIVKIKRLLIFH